VGSLRYLVHTRPDLAFAVGYVSRLMERPTVEHLQVVKRILRYVVGTLDYGLVYRRIPGTASFVGYCDSDLAGDVDTSKSTSGTMFFVGGCLVCWQSTKQKVVALSNVCVFWASVINHLLYLLGIRESLIIFHKRENMFLPFSSICH